jgi:large subunit ribosomal protein L9
VLSSPIKAVGVYAVKLVLHAEVSIEVKVNVARSEAEAEAQVSTEALLDEGVTIEGEEEAEGEADEAATA